MDIQKHTDDFFKTLLQFRLSYDVSKHLTEQTENNWREFEEKQHTNSYPIKGWGLIAHKSLLDSWTLQEDNLLHEEDLNPSNTGAEINSFPRDTVSIIYIFSLLEDYGNTVCDELNPSYRKSRQAWHRDIHGDADWNCNSKQQEMLKNFCKPFGFNLTDVPISIVEALVKLKKQRNSIIHELKHSNNFEVYFSYVIAIACCIYFCLGVAKPEIKLYLWEDYENKYG